MIINKIAIAIPGAKKPLDFNFYQTPSGDFHLHTIGQHKKVILREDQFLKLYKKYINNFEPSNIFDAEFFGKVDKNLIEKFLVFLEGVVNRTTLEKVKKEYKSILDLKNPNKSFK